MHLVLYWPRHQTFRTKFYSSMWSGLWRFYQIFLFSFLFWRTRRIITIAQLTSLPDISKQMISRLGLRSIVQPLNMTTIRPTHILPKVLGCAVLPISQMDGPGIFLLLTKFFPRGLWKAFQYFQTLKKEQTSYSWRQWLLLFFLRLANCIWPFWKFNRRGVSGGKSEEFWK